MVFKELFQQGGWIMLPLLGCSVAALTVIIERLCYFVRLTRHGQTVMDDARAALRVVANRAASETDSSAFATQYRGPLPETLRAGLKAFSEGENTNQIERAMEEAALGAFALARRGLPVLDTVITVAPLLGLLGTITGMMATFRAVAARVTGAGATSDPAGVTAGIAEALIATATGIAIAIVALLFYNAFNAQIEHLITETERRATQLLREIEKSRETASTHQADDAS